ncbi:MAG: flagellar type III secretion system pore protein FliP [Proteobacteria bacterium]|nr:flagellar type III secretion system pore protein FliP [Pseudomonadota bacterium]
MKHFKYAILLGLFFTMPVFADGIVSWTGVPSHGGMTYTLSIQTLLFLTSLTFLPAILLMMTAFTRIIIVLSLLRQALGTLQTPPNQVLIGLALFLTFFVMSPVLNKMYVTAYQPYSSHQIGLTEALGRAEKPLKTFMLHQTRESDIALFVRIAHTGPIARPDDTPMRILVPAYVISELKTAFQIGFVLFIPFLIIDMVVSSVLMSLGMMMLSPVIISLPFKIMLFVLVDGWSLVIGSLMKSFY